MPTGLPRAGRQVDWPAIVEQAIERRACRWPSAAASTAPANGRRRRARRCRCTATPTCWRCCCATCSTTRCAMRPPAALVDLRFGATGLEVENDGAGAAARGAGAPGRALPPRPTARTKAAAAWAFRSCSASPRCTAWRCATARADGTAGRRRACAELSCDLSLRQQRAHLLAAAGVGDLAAGPRRRLQRALEVGHGLVGVPGLDQVLAVEEVRVDALRVDRQRLLQQLLGLGLVAEAQRPARHLVVQHAQAVVGRAVERLAVDLDRLLVHRLGLLDQAQRAQAALLAGPAS